MTSSAEQTTVDMELKKAFHDLQMKRLETQQKLRLADVQIEGHRQVVRRSELTQNELVGLEDITPMYQAIGRMFLKQPKQKNLEMLTDRITKAQEKVKSLEANKEYLQQGLKDCEENLREALHAKQATMQSVR